MSTNKIPTLEETIERMKTEIIAESRIPDEASDFGYRDPRGGRALLELAPVPSWHELQFRRA